MQIELLTALKAAMRPETIRQELERQIDALQSLQQDALASHQGSQLRDGLQEIINNLSGLSQQQATSVAPEIAFASLATDGQLASSASELLGAQEFAELLINCSLDGIVAYDRKCRFTVWNPGMERLSGLTSKDALGKNAFEVLPFLKETNEDQAMLATLAGCWTEHRDRPFFVPRTGRKGFFEAHYSPLRDRNGEIMGGLAIFRDVTERKEAEKKLLQAERLSAISQMVTGMAHESRNALQRSQACLDVLSLKTQDRPEAQDLIARIQRAQDHLHHLYEEVRAYASPIKLELQQCDLASVLDQAWTDVVSAQNHAKAVTLRSLVGSTDCTVRVDPKTIRRVFYNVLENSLTAATEPGKICVVWNETEGEAGPQLVITLQDNGPGLTAEQRNRIFEPFFTTKTQGTGLGMAIAKRIVEAHGGQIAARPNPAAGAEIQITLPRNANQ